MTRHAGPFALFGYALVAIAGVLLRPALPIDETRYLAVALEMWRSGDYFVLSKNFDLYTHKPPMLFWAINLVWSVTGVSETAARLVGPAFALLTLYLTGRLARLLWPEDTGLQGRAMLALAGLLGFTIFGGLTMFDAALAAATVGGMIALVKALSTGQRRYWLALGLAMAAGGLIKGPVIVLHVLPAALLAPVWAGARFGVTWRTALTGTAIALGVGFALVGLWVVPASILGGQEYRDAILWTQSAGRVVNSFAHARPWWSFLAAMPIMLLPWVAMPAFWRGVFRQDWRDAGLLLCAIWIGFALVIFSMMSGKQLHYLVPELAAFALVISRGLPARASAAVPSLLLAGLAVAAIWASLSGASPGAIDALLAPRYMLLVWGLVILAISLIALRTRGIMGGAILSLGVVLAFDMLVGMTDVHAEFDSRPIAIEAAQYDQDGIAFYGARYNAEFNFAGRLTHPVAELQSPDELRRWAKAHPNAVVIARKDRDHPDWPAHKAIHFRNAPYAIWRTEDAVFPEGSS